MERGYIGRILIPLTAVLFFLELGAIQTGGGELRPRAAEPGTRLEAHAGYRLVERLSVKNEVACVWEGMNVCILRLPDLQRRIVYQTTQDIYDLAWSCDRNKLFLACGSEILAVEIDRAPDLPQPLTHSMLRPWYSHQDLTPTTCAWDMFPRPDGEVVYMHTVYGDASFASSIRCGQRIYVKDEGEYRIHNATVNFAKNRMLVTLTDGTVELRTVRGQLLKRFPLRENGVHSVYHVNLHPNRETAYFEAWGEHDSADLLELDLKTGSMKSLFSGRHLMPSLSPTGDALAFHHDGQLWILDTQSGERTNIVSLGGSTSVEPAAWSQDGGLLVASLVEYHTEEGPRKIPICVRRQVYTVFVDTRAKEVLAAPELHRKPVVRY